jgi:dipeptidyl aminopeptidase/acylaminoacyl peptidase
VAFVGNGDPLTQTFTMGGVSREETTEQRDIWVTTVDGSGPAVRIPYPGDEVGVTWLPNGRIASVAEEGIWTFEADGSDRRHIYAGPMPWVMTRNVGVWASLESSPDGRYLAVIFYNSHENLVVDVDGKNAVIVDDGERYHWAVGDISWSPTGDDYVYACMVDGHPGTRLASSDGKADRLLDPWLGQPAWSPRGDLIAGVDNPAGDLYRDLVTIRPDGSDRRTILTVPPNLKIDHQHSVGWSPDGRSIAFSVGYAYAASVPPGAQPH